LAEQHPPALRLSSECAGIDDDQARAIYRAMLATSDDEGVET
jgi:hypothetical protein